MSDTTGRFDQKDLETNPYGKCVECDANCPTPGMAREHMTESHHRIRILNPDRQSRIEMNVSFDIEDALSRMFDELYQLVEDGDVTAEELTRAIESGPSLDGEWDNYLRDVTS